MVDLLGRASTALRRLAWRVVTPGISGLTPTEILLDGIEALELLDAEVRATQQQATTARAEAQRLAREVDRLRADVDHARGVIRMMEDTERTLRASVRMLDTELQRHSTSDREQLAALGARS
jgi:septal ring factor EnvC (AmiA/AmiB activator)